MALLINCHLARNFLGGKRKETTTITSKKVAYPDSDDMYGSGAPEGATVHSRFVINPS